MPIKKKPAPRKPTAAPDEDNTSIFDHFGLQEPSQGGRKSSETSKKAEDDRIQALIGRLDALEGQVKDKDRTIASLLSNPATVVDVSGVNKGAEYKGVDLSGLPDPVVDPEGNQKALQERITKAIQEGIAAERASQNEAMGRERAQTNKVDGLWERFNTKYEDLAEDADIVELAATKVAKEAEAKGLDLNRYIFGAGDTFLDDVAAKVKSMKSDWGVGEQEEGTEGDQDDGTDEVRTQGIFGGVESGGKPAPGKGGDPSKGGMIEDLQTIQKSTGFY